MYALVMQEGDFEFLIDPRDLWSVPRVVVRSGLEMLLRRFAHGELND